MTVLPDRLAALDGIELHDGSHSNFDQGHCAMEVVSWLAGEGFTDAPACASVVLRRYTITLNDRWSFERRQELKPYLVRMIGTGNDGKDALREQIAARYLLTNLLEPWLRLAGMDSEADEIAGLVAAPLVEQRAAIRRWSDAAWRLRSARWSELRAKVRAKLEKRGYPTAVAAAADAAAAAAADVAADAVADADADAAAAAAAVVAAVADADADADAVADAVADADVAADVAAAAGQSPYSAAYKAARDYYREHPLPVSQQIADLAATQRGLALELLDAMIDPVVAS